MNYNQNAIWHQRFHREQSHEFFSKMTCMDELAGKKPLLTKKIINKRLAWCLEKNLIQQYTETNAN